MVDYVAQFRDHLAQVQAHLNGTQHKALPPSFIGTAGYWTSLEKDKFFHGLAIYSRYRPDLISAHIGTKTVLDVCVYLNSLEQAVTSTGRHFHRRRLDGAIEVSSKFIDWEEREASELVASESRWAKKRERGVTEWDEKEYVLKSLDEDYLMAIESMLRDAEYAPGERLDEPDVNENEGRAPRSQIAMVINQGASLLDLTSEGYHYVPPIWIDSSSISAVTEQPATKFEATQLLEVEHTPTNGGQNTSACLGRAIDSPTRELSPASRRRYKKRLYMRQKRAKSKGQEEVNATVQRLRPGRKKKGKNPSTLGVTGMAEGDEAGDFESRVDSGEVSDEEDTQLAKKADIATSLTPQAHSSPSQDQIKRLDPQDGETKIDKIKESLMNLGITAETLQNRGLGLFHFSAMKRLMQSDDTAVKSISSDTVQLLQTILTDFLTEVIHRVVILYEQEQMMKGNIKVWRSSGEINTGHVDHALRMIGWDASMPHPQILDTEDPDILLEDQHESNDTAPSTPSLSLHRQLHTPLIVLPHDSLGVLPSTSENDLMALETDQDALSKEMAEEEKLDRQDEAIAAAYEADFWKMTKVLDNATQ
ncbi:hypothetical protein AX16_002016 [Volvariella volvacea WC 439]|nr:hypothetical protein AX16_002016 [Volvariella volvacea WC 439]